jgi:hypothetical protein
MGLTGVAWACRAGKGGTAGARVKPSCARQGVLAQISAAAPSKRLLVIRIDNFLDRKAKDRFHRRKPAFAP